MVTMCRVDERLLHGQVAVTWLSHINPDAIVIANDEVMVNEVAKMALKMAKPDGIKMAIRTVDGAVDLITKPETKNVRILLLVKEIKDVRRIVAQCNEIDYLNIGGIKPQKGVLKLTSRVALTQENLDDLNIISDRVKRIDFQMVPSEEAKNIRQILENRNG